MSNQISPLAYIDPSAKLGDGNQIGPFCFIDKGVEIPRMQHQYSPTRPEVQRRRHSCYHWQQQ